MNYFKIIILFFLFAVTACSETKPTSSEKLSRVDHLPFYDEATFTPHWISPNDEKLNNFHKISPFQLFNQDGAIITEKNFDGKIYVTDFFFITCPGICSKMTANLSSVQEAFKNDDEILLLSHSVTPKVDSIAKLKAYAEERGVISDKWHLATGNRRDIYNLGRNEYFIEESMGLEKSEFDFLHTENFVLIDRDRHIRGIYNGLSKPAIKQLIADIKTLKKE